MLIKDILEHKRTINNVARISSFSSLLLAICSGINTTHFRFHRRFFLLFRKINTIIAIAYKKIKPKKNIYANNFSFLCFSIFFLFIFCLKGVTFSFFMQLLPKQWLLSDDDLCLTFTTNHNSFVDFRPTSCLYFNELFQADDLTEISSVNFFHLFNKYAGTEPQDYHFLYRINGIVELCRDEKCYFLE